MPYRRWLNRAPKLEFVLILFILWNVGMTMLGLWKSLWIIGLVVNFFFVVVLAEKVGQNISVSYKSLYEQSLAVAFPILLLISWELLVRGGILNPRWFPPPSKVLQALWEMAISYDSFTKTSLLGRPWLLPQKFSEEGWQGILSLLKESHILLTLFRVFAGFFFGLNYS